MKPHRVLQVIGELAFVAALILPVSALGAQQKQKPVRIADASHSSAPAPPRKSAVATSAPTNEYVIGPQDLLAIDVWKQPEISQVEPVRIDGKITIPLIGEVQASGKTPDALQNEIAQKLSAYIQKPEVTVIVRQPNSQRFNIIGDVLRPGSYPLRARMTVLDALAVAGGFREFAKVTHIYVIQKLAGGSARRIRFNYKDAVRGKKRYLDLRLQPGDTIIVP